MASVEDGAGIDLVAALAAVRQLVAEQRATCLWFLSEDFLPADVGEAIRALRWIEQSADRETYVKARRLREWLSHDSSATSVGSLRRPA
ncbi:MAG: hypothetical protein HY903_16080 [Deltaproteobacteria bacterium]|nr:hypothetical protein [Deltaproteobacteria bacterium]